MKISLSFPKPEFGYERFDAQIADADARGCPVLHLVVGARALGHKVVDQLLDVHELGQLYAGELTDQEVHLVIDLRDCTFVDPYGSTVIHSLVSQVSHRAARVWLCLPDLPHVRAYCGVIGLTEALRDHVTLVGEAYRQRPSDNSPVLVPTRPERADSRLKRRA